MYAFVESVQEKKLRRLENQNVGGSNICQPSYLPTFLLSYSSSSHFPIFRNIFVYPCFSVISLSSSLVSFSNVFETSRCCQSLGYD